MPAASAISSNLMGARLSVESFDVFAGVPGNPDRGVGLLDREVDWNAIPHRSARAQNRMKARQRRVTIANRTVEL